MSNENLSQEDIEALLREVQESGSEPDLTEDLHEVEPGDITGAFDTKPAIDGLVPDTDELLVPESKKAGKDPMVQVAQFQEFEMQPGSEKAVSDMDVLLDIPLSISVELGKSRCYVKDLLNLTVGSIVELDRLAGDPVDILVNGKMFAKGEVVVIDENFGVRIQEILSKDQKNKNR
ncbi:MAG: flagellar motor switch protein FliN [Acutalibacteraceae bacterium]|jgi:flagellar motor switch protein FliN/FliY|nr:flagellar motor switch protein FliN [Bacillota bacterium]